MPDLATQFCFRPLLRFGLRTSTTMRSRHLILPGNRNKFIWKDATLSFLVNYHYIMFLFSGIDIGGITYMTKFNVEEAREVQLY